MKRLIPLALALAFAACSTAALAANPLSVHILDLQSGQPTAGVTVTLEQKNGEGWQRLGSAVTNAQGRIAAMYPAETPMQAGDYRIVAEEGEADDEVKTVADFDDEDDLVTEELAEIYRQQGLNDEACAIYRKLSLRNPEKSVYFAELIRKMEEQKL